MIELWNDDLIKILILIKENPKKAVNLIDIKISKNLSYSEKNGNTKIKAKWHSKEGDQWRKI